MSDPAAADRRRFALWAAGALLVLLPLWWWLGAGAAAAILRPVAGAVSQIAGLGPIQSVAEGWAVRTPYTGGGAAYTHLMADHQVKRLLLSVPVLLALLLAPPRARLSWRAALACVVVLVLVFAVSPTLVAYGELAGMLDPAKARFQTGRLDQPPLPGLVAQAVILGRYISLTITPLLAPIILWAVVNPHARALFVGHLRDPAINTD